MSIADALLRKNLTIALPCGQRVTLRRPSALDFIEAAEMAAREPARLRAFLAHRHVLGEDGQPALPTLEAALEADGRLVWEIGAECEKLYEEGRD